MIAHAPVSDLSESFELSPVVWSALSRVATKQLDHDGLDQGSSHKVDVSLIGHVDGVPFRQSFSSSVNVGHDFERATSSTPELPSLIATILSRLNLATREKLLREIPESFEMHQQSFGDVDAELLEQARDFLQRLRRKKTVIARGAISCDFELSGN